MATSARTRPRVDDEQDPSATFSDFLNAVSEAVEDDDVDVAPAPVAAPVAPVAPAPSAGLPETLMTEQGLFVLDAASGTYRLIPVVQEPAPVVPPTPVSRLDQIRRERELLEGQRAITTDVIVISRAQQRINDLNNEEALLAYLPPSDDGEQWFGHQKSRRFRTPVPGRAEEIVFESNIYITSDPYEIAALRRLIKSRSEGSDLVALEPGQKAYFHKDSSFLGWEKDDSPNVQSWLKQKMLRAY